MTPNLDQLERRMRDDGYEEDEIEARTSNLASDWYDERKDRESEDRRDGT